MAHQSLPYLARNPGMNRRIFLRNSALGAFGVAFSGFPNINETQKVEIQQIYHPEEFGRRVPKPIGTMPMGVLGSTGIKVSKFGFGSHLWTEIVHFEKEREFMVREALDLGINNFDIYDIEQKCFQYEPMGRYLKPVINDVVISISIRPYDGRTLEEEFERDLRLFGREYIDLVRYHSFTPESKNWKDWETLFKYREQGKIRAIGIPTHSVQMLEIPLAELPLDFVMLPFNFYHNWTWLHKGMVLDNYNPLIRDLKERGIGVIAMKPLASDWLIYPFKKLAEKYDDTGEVNLAKAALRYIINSGVDIDLTIAGMFYPFHLYEDVDAYFHPEMSDKERKILKQVRDTTKVTAKNYLPPHYRFLDEWAPCRWDDRDLFA